MSVRRTHNRVKTEPWGSDLENVLKKSKRFYSSAGKFRISQYGMVYSTFVPFPVETESFHSPEGVDFKKINKRWKVVASPFLDLELFNEIKEFFENEKN